MTGARHVPVLLEEVMAALAPERGGAFVDATFGAGGYSAALLERGAGRVVAIDRDPRAIRGGAALAERWPGRLALVEGRFGELDALAGAEGAAPAQGVALDLGVSSMQLDEGGRGFSFMRDGPLDMRMGDEGPSAADLVNEAEPEALAEILRAYGEERGARRIALAVARARDADPIRTTGRLAEVVESVSAPKRPGQPHPATRTFQAIRIAVNDELGELARGLSAAERALGEGGVLAVVTFHSLEDRMVKRFLQLRAGEAPRASRHAPEREGPAAGFALLFRGAVAPGEAEIARNPRARSAKLRAARRTAAPAAAADPRALGAPEPRLHGEGRGRGRRR